MNTNSSRRQFLQTTAAAGVTIMKARTVFGFSANSAVNLGIIGCGGRGTHVASSFMEHTNTRVAAIADLFEDRLEKGREHFNKNNTAKGYPELSKSRLFCGSAAYKRLLDQKDVDAVLIATPPFLHPEHLAATVDAGKHVYCEKPVSVDVHGCREVEYAGEKAEGQLSLAVGFQIRHATPFVEMVTRIHNGALGDIVMAEGDYLAGSITLPEYPGTSDDELRIRHWIYDRALSGDIIVEQGIHVIDIFNWVLHAHPLKARGTGGREGRSDTGNNWSHFMVTYEYPGTIPVSFHSTQYNPGYGDVFERFFGTKGIAESHYTGGVFIKGENEWDSGAARGTREEINKKDWAAGKFKSALEDADPNKEKAFIESIITGKYINEAHEGAQSALSGILGRTAAYRGDEVTWDEIITSDKKWDPMIDLTRFDT